MALNADAAKQSLNIIALICAILVTAYSVKLYLSRKRKFLFFLISGYSLAIIMRTLVFLNIDVTSLISYSWILWTLGLYYLYKELNEKSITINEENARIMEKTKIIIEAEKAKLLIKEKEE